MRPSRWAGKRTAVPAPALAPERFQDQLVHFNGLAGRRKPPKSSLVETVGFGDGAGGAGRGGGAGAAGERVHPLADLLLGAEEQERSTDADAVAGAQSADLHDVAVDAGAVGAFEVGDDDLAVVELDLGMEAADALVVEPEDVALLPADRDRGWKVPIDFALVDP